MNTPYRDVEIIREVMKILEKTIEELADVLSNLKVEEKDEAYKVNITSKRTN